MEILNQLKVINKKMPQEAMAHEIGVSVSTLNRWLCGKFEPSKHVIASIERFIQSKK